MGSLAGTSIMGRATIALQRGLMALAEDYGVTITVDGQDGTIEAVLPPSDADCTLTLDGMREVRTVTLFVDVDAAWTPMNGQRITFHARDWVVHSVTNTPSHWRLQLIDPDA